MPQDLIGQVLLSQFRVDAFIASGGMGAVYRVWDTRRSVPLAMKVLHAELADDPAVLKRFKREAQSLTHLAHPNIVPFYGLFETPDFIFLLERFVDGSTLGDVLRKRQKQPMPIIETLAYLKPLCAALGYAHVNGVVHCDVKPGNVMVDQGGSVYLTDFGIARHAASTTTTTGTSGTPAYMAPEQIQAQPLTPATDVYALGIMLFEMLTGQRPFRGDEPASEGLGATTGMRILYAHLHLDPPDPSSVNPAIPPALAQVIIRALDKQPAVRFAGVQELFQAACTAAGVDPDQLPARVTNIPSPKRFEPPPPPPPHRNVLPWVAGGVGLGCLVLLGVMALGMFWWLSTRTPATPQPTRYEAMKPTYESLPTENAPPTQGTPSGVKTDQGPVYTAAAYTLQAQLTETALAAPLPTLVEPTQIPEPTLLPAATPVPTTTPTPSPTPAAPELGTLSGAGTVRITGDNDADKDANFYGPHLSPDQRHLVAFAKISGYWQVVELNPDTGGVVRYLTSGTDNYDHPRFSPDGQTLLVASDRSGDWNIYLMDFATGGLTRQLTDGPGASIAPYWMPDGESYVYASKADGDYDIYIGYLDGSTPQSLTSNTVFDGSPTVSPDGRYVAYYSTAEGDPDVFLLDLQTLEALRVTQSTGRSAEPYFSPDGQWLAFESNRTGNYDLWAIRLDGSSELRHVTTGSDHEQVPVFSPDGKWLFYQAQADGDGLYDIFRMSWP